jgi:hypothetical protein
MEHHRINRYIVVAGINLDTPDDDKGPQTRAATAWVASKFPDIQQDRQNAFKHLQQSPLLWTVVRVPMILFKEGKNAVTVNLKDCEGTVITAGDIAYFLVAQITDGSYIRASPFISSKD